MDKNYNKFSQFLSQVIKYQSGYECLGFFGSWGELPTQAEIEAIIDHLYDLHAKGDEYINAHNEQTWDRINNGLSAPKVSAPPTRGWIYVIESGGFYKIGRAKRINDRVRTYSTENPNEIKLIYKQEVCDYKKVERDLLTQYVHKKHRGEWHKLLPGDIEAIKDYLCIVDF